MKIHVLGLPRPAFLIALLLAVGGAWSHYSGGTAPRSRLASVPVLSWDALDPFTRDKEFAFTVQEAVMVSVQVSDLWGRLVYQVPPSTFPAGKFVLPWNGRLDATGRDAPPGVYEVKYQLGYHTATRLLVLGGIP